MFAKEIETIIGRRKTKSVKNKGNIIRLIVEKIVRLLEIIIQIIPREIKTIIDKIRKK